MCGILGLLCHSDGEKMKELVKKCYLMQVKQGSEGFGLLLRKKRNGRIYRRRTETSREIFNDKIWKKVKAGDLLVFHHRNPTSTPNLPECNHPLSNENKSIYLAHIGIIAHSYHLEKNHCFESEIEEITKTRERIYRYSCFTDSEIALHRLEEILEKTDRASAMKQLCEEFNSSVFFVVFSDEHRLYLCSNGGHSLYLHGGYIASSRLWKSARHLNHIYGYFDGKKRELVTKNIKPSFIYSFSPKKEGFYEKELSEFLQKRKEYCSMATEGEGCEDCPLLEQCEEDLRYSYYYPYIF